MSENARPITPDGVVWFPSKVDWWIRIAMFMPPLGSLAALATSLASRDRGEVVEAAVTCVAVVLVYVVVVVPIRYGVGSDSLTVRFGLFRVAVPWDRITEVTPTRSPWSAPAHRRPTRRPSSTWSLLARA